MCGGVDGSVVVLAAKWKNVKMHELLDMLPRFFILQNMTWYDGSTSNQNHFFLMLEFIVKKWLGSIVHVGQALQWHVNHLEQFTSAFTLN